LERDLRARINYVASIKHVNRRAHAACNFVDLELPSSSCTCCRPYRMKFLYSCVAAVDKIVT